MNEEIIEAVGHSMRGKRCARRRLLMLTWTAVAALPLGTAVALDATPDINIIRGGNETRLTDVLPVETKELETSPERASETPPDRGSRQAPGVRPDVASLRKADPPASIPTSVTPPRIRRELDGIQVRLNEVFVLVQDLPQGIVPKGLLKKLKKVEEKLPEVQGLQLLPEVKVPVRIPPIRIPKLHLLPRVEVQVPDLKLPKLELPSGKPHPKAPIEEAEVPEEEAPPVETEDETLVSTEEVVEVAEQATDILQQLPQLKALNGVIK